MGEVPVPTEMTYSAGFASAVAEEMSTNPDIFVIGTDLVHRGGLNADILVGGTISVGDAVEVAT